VLSAQHRALAFGQPVWHNRQRAGLEQSSELVLTCRAV